MRELNCPNCKRDLEAWNNRPDLWINYCPACGEKLPQMEVDALRRLSTGQEIVDKIRGNVLDMLDNYSDGINADELAQRAWESENCDGVVFYSNYGADNFVCRHMQWVDGAMEYCCDNFGSDHYVKMRAECNDRFLVAAFITATEIYLYNQLGIDQNEGVLSEERIQEIRRMVEEKDYKEEW